MAKDHHHVALPPTIMHVIEEFVSALRADPAIEQEAIDRLEKLLRAGTIPKPQDLQAVLFQVPEDDKS